MGNLYHITLRKVPYLTGYRAAHHIHYPVLIAPMGGVANLVPPPLRVRPNVVSRVARRNPPGYARSSATEGASEHSCRSLTRAYINRMNHFFHTCLSIVS